MNPFRGKGYLPFKRFLDFCLAAIGILILSPILLLVAILVRAKLGAPIIFRQQRPGLKGKIFSIYKFRTMTNERDQKGELLPNDQRKTPFGSLLRKTSLDELPELFNVLFGSMSVVGPRPLLPEYLPYYTAEEMRRHDVRPGITGAAQVAGRNRLSWEERFTADVAYVDNISLWLDIKIIVKTIGKVFTRSDIIVTPQGQKLNELRKGKINEQP